MTAGLARPLESATRSVPAGRNPVGTGTNRRGFLPLMLAPMIVLLAAFTLYPFISVIVFALQKKDLSQPADTGFAGLDNFVAVLTDQGLLYSAFFTVLLVVVCVCVEFGLGFLIATLLWRPVPGNRLFLSLIVLPFAASPVATYLAWRLMLAPDGGQVNALLTAIGLPAVDWTSDPSLAVISIMIVDIWQWTPFVILVMLAGLQSLPHDVFEAAALDGSGAWARATRIALPMLRPLVAFVVTFRAIDAVRTFDSMWIITKGGPGAATESLVVRVYRDAFTNLNIGEASALGLLILIVVAILGRLFAAPALRRLEH